MIKTAFEFNDHLFPVLYEKHPAIKTGRGSKWLRTLTKTLVMKLAILLLSAVFFQAQASVTAQNVTISGKEITLKQIFQAIEKQTDFVVFSNESFLAKAKTVSISVHNVSVTELLNLVLKDQPVQYSIRNKTIFLSPKIIAPADQLSNFLQPAAPSLIINGVLRTKEGELLSGASINIKQTNSGSITDNKGSFQLKTDQENPVLVISMIGYETAELHIKKTATGYQLLKSSGAQVAFDGSSPGLINLMVTLKKSASILDQTQVTAYGRTTRRMATGNIGTVKAEEIERQPVMTVLDALIGKVPGVNINPVSGNAASPVLVTIRGRNSINPNAIADPLYVIDGIPMTTLNASMFNHPMNMGAVQGGITNTIGENPLLSINPRDIESIDILKDADATAIYGSRGANGVILITTKKGKPGPTRFNLRINQGTKMLERYPRLMNTEEYLAVRREAFRNDGITPDEFNAPDLKRWDPTKYTDWQRMFIGTGSVTAVDASVSGGNMQMNYGISANYTTQKEIMNNGGKNERAGLRTTFGHSSLDKKFEFSFSNNLAFTEVYAFNASSFGKIAPNAPDIYNSKGEFNFAPFRGRTDNSQFPFTNLKKPSESNTFSLQSNINLKYEIIKGLNIQFNGGYHYTTNKNANYSPEAAADPQFGAFSQAIFGNTASKSWQIEPQLHYNTFLGKGNLSVQLITNMQSANTDAETIIGTMFPNDAMMKSYNNALLKSFIVGYKEYKYISASSIIRYAWDNKYIINLNARRDGSSRFGPGKQFGNFGSVGLAWIASDEKWMKQLLPSWVSFLKFRGSYGITGNDGIGDYEYLSRWSKELPLESRTIFKYNGTDAFNVISPLNQEFQWESTIKQEIAASAGFWNNRINLDLAFYRNLSKNQLTTIPIPSYTGFSNAVSNWPAEVENTGIEISVNARLIDTKDWGLQFSFNFSRSWNKLLDFPNLESSNYKGMLRKGYSTSTRFVLKYTGIDPMTGNYTFEDRNKDGRINTPGTNFPESEMDDRYIAIETAIPKYEGGFGFNINYKSLFLHSQFQFTNRYRPDPYLTNTVGGRPNIALPEDVKNNHWQQPGDLAKYPRYTTGGLGPITSSDANFVNGSFMRMTNLSLSWQLPDAWIKKVKLKDVQLAIQTQNLFTISAYPGIDPTITNAYNATPIPRTISTTISINF